MSVENQVEIDKRAIRAARKDAVKGATACKLMYVCDTDKGYTRKRMGKGFIYFEGNKKITDEKLLTRFKQLVIPPAWEKVWICKSAEGHLQVTGYDKLNRKQYRYHARWNILRNHTKFYSLLSFGKLLPAIRQQLQNDLSLPGFPQQKVLAAVVSLIDRTSMRIGNDIYEKLYGSFGLSTLKNKHAKVQGSKVSFAFTGKKGIKHNITLRSKRLAKIVRACQDIPGKKLFEYYDENDSVHPIDSGMVNSYIRSISNDNYTAKDFRTWSACVHSLLAFKQVGEYETETEKKEKINSALDLVARQLGNTRTVCRKYYVHPNIIQLFDKKKLSDYIANLNGITATDELSKLAAEEKILMKILEETS